MYGEIKLCISDYSPITQTEANIKHVNTATGEIFDATFKTRERIKLLEKERGSSFHNSIIPCMGKEEHFCCCYCYTKVPYTPPQILMRRFFIIGPAASTYLSSNRVRRMIDTLATLQPISCPSCPGNFNSPLFQNSSLSIAMGS